ncbi:MAG TPA: ATP-binding protein [Acidimicrobiales bacterium]
MGTVLSGKVYDAALGVDEEPRAARGRHTPQHAAPAGRAAAGERAGEAPAAPRAVRAFLQYLPRGNTLDQRTFTRRHLLLSWVLLLHVPGLFVLGAVRSFDLWHVALELTVPVACVVFGRLSINRRLAAFFVTAGLVYCSVVLVHLSGGMIEAHFHFFILIGLIALYQDWIPFLWNVVFTVASHGLGSTVSADLMFNHDAGQARPWTWAAIHGVAVLAACVGEVIFWRSTEQEQERNVQLVADLAAADAQRRQAMSELLVNLARRNQSLLNRQLEVITDLEGREEEPDVLEELFRLDHLATRIRRNAESLLVLSGDDPARRWGNPVSLADVARAAAAEVEEYRRVEVLVNDHIEVAGRAVADLAHLLAELIENATTFSPPSTQVRVHSQLAPSDPRATVVSIEDEGIGMSDDDLRAANALLDDVPEVDLGRSTMLGFHVVARLAQRYGITVRLAPTPGGGVTAMVALPADLVSERRSDSPATVGATTGGGAYSRGAGFAVAWSGLDGTSRLARLNGLGAFDPPGGRSPLVQPAARPLLDGPALPPAPEVAPPAPPAPPALPEPLRPLPEPIPALAAPPPPAPEPPATNGGPDVRPPDWWWQSASFLPAAGGAAATSAAGDPAAGSAGGPPPDRAVPRTSVWPPQPPEQVLRPVAEGLVRRVPGTHLAPALRREGSGGGQAPAPRPAPARDPDQVRSMLSKFQASQRAGRAAADATLADPFQERR